MYFDFLSIDLNSIIFTLINTLLLFLVIKKFLFKPVLAMLEARQNDVKETYDKADQALESAKESEQQYKSLINNARDESAEIINNATKTANKRAEEILSNAKSNADAIMKKSNADIEREMANARIAIKDEVTDLAILMAEKIVDKEINNNDYRRFIDEFIENVGEGND